MKESWTNVEWIMTEWWLWGWPTIRHDWWQMHQACFGCPCNLSIIPRCSLAFLAVNHVWPRMAGVDSMGFHGLKTSCKVGQYQLYIIVNGVETPLHGLTKSFFFSPLLVEFFHPTYNWLVGAHSVQHVNFLVEIQLPKFPTYENQYQNVMDRRIFGRRFTMSGQPYEGPARYTGSV